MLREDAQLAEKKDVLWTPLAREEFASKLFISKFWLAGLVQILKIKKQLKKVEYFVEKW